MANQDKIPEWAPRVSKISLRRLYRRDAQGIQDEELVEDVGYALLSRCKSFLEANMAVGGKATCPQCGRIVLHHGDKEEVLRCEPCGWELTWGTYFETIQKKQLSGAGPVIELFENYVHSFLEAQTYREKMYQVDRLIHGFHWHHKFGATRPVAVNLIQGRLPDVIELLDHLSAGNDSTPGVQARREEWITESQYVRSWINKKS